MAEMPEVAKNDTASQANQQFIRDQQQAQQAGSGKTPASNIAEAAVKALPYGLHDGTFSHIFRHIPFLKNLFGPISESTDTEYSMHADKTMPLQDMEGLVGQYNVQGGVLAKFLEYFTREFNLGEAPGHGSEAGDATAGIQHADVNTSTGSGDSGSFSSSSSGGTGDFQQMNFGGAQIMDNTAGIDSHVRIEAPAGTGRGGGAGGNSGGGGGFGLG